MLSGRYDEKVDVPALVVCGGWKLVVELIAGWHVAQIHINSWSESFWGAYFRQGEQPIYGCYDSLLSAIGFPAFADARVSPGFIANHT